MHGAFESSSLSHNLLHRETNLSPFHDSGK